MFRDFIKKFFPHRHTWVEYRLMTNRYRTVFFCRHCTCGLRQIRNSGPMGDKGWTDMNKPLRHDWEQKWLDEAVPMD